MPTYVYEVILPNGKAGERFELVQAMMDEPLTTHPETGLPVRRVFLPPAIAGKYSPMKTDSALKDDKKLERMGFTKYVKSGDGTYDKVVGQGPDSIQK